MADLAELVPLPRTLDEFLAWREGQAEDYEFIGGEPVPRGVASRRHTIIKGNIYRQLANELEGGRFTVYVDGLELRRPGLAARPDIVVSRAAPDFTTPVESEPVVIVEVGSASSFGRDMASKLEAYRRFPTLEHYLVVHPGRRCVIRHDRETRDRLTQLWQSEGALDLPAVGTSLAFEAVFRGVPDDAGEPEEPFEED